MFGFIRATWNLLVDWTKGTTEVVPKDLIQHHDLYIALFARTSNPRTYHWALLVCKSNDKPTATSGFRYHVTNSIPNLDPKNPNPPQLNKDGRIPWRFEAQPLVNAFTASPLLARVLISTITDFERLPAALEAVPLVQEVKSWTCRVWVRDALANVAEQDLIDLPSQLPEPKTAPAADGRLSLTDASWTAVENACLKYLESKHAIFRWRNASDGRWVDGEIPTWDLQLEKELVA
ncbi:MAG: hypothetical protein Q9227_004661 [Pyrenula ochraceoflavens]